jgi:hypothetical protein
MQCGLKRLHLIMVWLFYLSRYFTGITQSNRGGEKGIRTPEGFHLNGFQDRRNRPLCHLSGVCDQDFTS